MTIITNYFGSNGAPDPQIYDNNTAGTRSARNPTQTNQTKTKHDKFSRKVFVKEDTSPTSALGFRCAHPSKRTQGAPPPLALAAPWARRTRTSGSGNRPRTPTPGWPPARALAAPRSKVGLGSLHRRLPDPVLDSFWILKVEKLFAYVRMPYLFHNTRRKTWEHPPKSAP